MTNSENYKFFKDQKFALIFLYDELMFRTNDVQNMVVDDQEKSLVISARGGEQKDGIHILNNGKFFEKQEDKRTSCFDLYMQTEHLTEEERAAIYKDDVLVFINRLIEMGKSKFVKQLVILAFDDGKLNIDSESSIIKIKSGGPEIVAEYMLSKFIGNFKIFSDDEVIDKEFDLRIEVNKDIDGYEKCEFNFDLDGDLSQLHKVDDSRTEIEMDGTVWDDSFERFQLSIDEIAVLKLNEKFKIPPRIWNVLNEEQFELLSNQAPSLLIEEMDFIGNNIFKLNFDSYESYCRLMESKAYSQNWNASMNAVLGNDGRYLGDGKSLARDGLIDE